MVAETRARGEATETTEGQVTAGDDVVVKLQFGTERGWQPRTACSVYRDPETGLPAPSAP
jgi:hypothetical protein